MRKLIVLIMTSVLATGAVANADQVTVVENPADYINVRGIFEKDGSALDSEGIVPYVTGTSPNHYRLNVDVADPNDELIQVAVCLYDSAVITQPDNTNCGGGHTNPGFYDSPTKNRPTTQWQGQMIQESAIQMAFLPGLYDTSLAGGTPGKSVGAAEPSFSGNYHFVSPEQTAGETYSRVTEVATPDSNVPVTNGDVWALEFAFALLTAAHHTDTWKIRVLATYDDGPNDKNVELIGEASYKVKYFGGFKNNTARDSDAVDYGNVAHGTSATKTIGTGEYYANFDSNVTLEASLFKATTDSALALGFSGDQDPQDGEVSLECGETGEAKTLFGEVAFNAAAGSDKVSKTLLTVDPGSQPVGDVDPSLAVEAPTHDCTFHAGTNIDTREYTNEITIGIVEVPQT